MMKRLAGAVVASVVCGGAVAAAQSADLEKKKAALIRTDLEFSEAAQKIGVGEAFVLYADPDATMLPAGQNAVTGRDRVRGQFADYPKGATLVKYCVWKKQPDGFWKWVVDVGTPSPEPGK